MSVLAWPGLPGDEGAWTALGLVVDGGAFTIGQIRCGIGEDGWGFDEI